MKKEEENKIMQFQLMDQNMQNILIQKQTLQAQTSEIENALKEVEKSKDKVFKVIGPTMVSADKETIKKELTSKKEILTIKLKNLEKQEKQIKEKFQSLQSEVLKNIKK